MRLKRWMSLALAAVLALAVAGIAIAHGGGGKAQKTEQVQATFTAKPDAAKTKTRQCTGVDGTYAISKEVANGTATGDERLSGNITIKSKSVVNTVTGLGWSEGKVYTKDATTGKLKGVSRFSAVITEGSKLEGFVAGKVKNPAPASGQTKAKGNGRQGKYHSELLANFSAAVAQDGTITGELGTGGGQNTAILHGEPCQKQQKQGDENRHAGSGDDDGKKGDDHRGGRGGDDDRK